MKKSAFPRQSLSWNVGVEPKSIWYIPERRYVWCIQAMWNWLPNAHSLFTIQGSKLPIKRLEPSVTHFNNYGC